RFSRDWSSDVCSSDLGDAFAADMVKRDGKYYWYISTNWSGIGVAVSDRPEGPFKDALGKPLLTNDDCFASTHSWACIDPAVFVEIGSASGRARRSLTG